VESFEAAEKVLGQQAIIASRKRLLFSVGPLSEATRSQLEARGCDITEDRQYQHEAEALPV